VSKAEGPRPDIVEEAERLLGAGKANGVVIRLIGGLAVYFHTDDIPAPLARLYGDIDVVTEKKAGRRAGELLVELGYEPAKEFNALNGDRRLVFYDGRNERKLDVFVGSFEMCHTIPIGERLAADERTIPLAELLLTKLQIVQLTEKDLHDTLTLLDRHEMGDHDEDTINVHVVARLTADDWGLWRTVKQNLERIREQIDSVGIDEESRARVVHRTDALWERIEAEPKTKKWRLRDRVGDRRRWYELPDEV
jgi:hypothetical protein